MGEVDYHSFQNDVSATYALLSLSGIATVESLSYLLDIWITDESRKKLEDLGYLYPKSVKDTECLLPRGKDWRFYYSVVAQAEYVEEDPTCQGQGNPLSPANSQSRMPGDNVIDEHGSFEELDQEQAEDLMNKAVADAKQTESEAGSESSDTPLHFIKGQKAKRRMMQAIHSVKLKANFVSRKKIKIDYNYRKGGHRVSTELPGEMILPKTTKKAILLLDVSGSMAEETLLSEMNAAVLELHKQDKLADVFAFDAELRDLTLSAGGDITELVGGGGTVISDDYLDKIHQKHQNKQHPNETQKKENLEIIVLTDDEICWDINDNDKKRFHVIDITRF